MKKRGFTLVELLAVITLVALLATVIIVVTSARYKEMRTELSSSQKTLIYSATEAYIEKYKNDYPTIEGSTYCILLSDLVSEGLLTDQMKNTLEDTDISLDMGVQVTVESKVNYHFEFHETESVCIK